MLNPDAATYLSNAAFVLERYLDGTLGTLQEIIAEDQRRAAIQADVENRRMVDVFGDTIGYKDVN